MIQHQTCDLGGLRTLNGYLLSLASPIDSYLEDHILGSTLYRIMDQGEEMGYFAIHEGGLLTLFHMRREDQRLGQRVLAEIRQRHGILGALVPTADEFFLSHVLDDYRELKMQAYFFADAGIDPTPTATAAAVQYRLACPDDAGPVRAATGDFTDDPADRISRDEVTIGILDGRIVAVGLIILSKLFARQASIGMFTTEPYRRKGIGSQTIVHLKRLSRAQGIAPLAGCSYKNAASKATLEAAGMVTRTRLLRFALWPRDDHPLEGGSDGW
jgi:GNAT superfamily N-acetyltransferase